MELEFGTGCEHVVTQKPENSIDRKVPLHKQHHRLIRAMYDSTMPAKVSPSCEQGGEEGFEGIPEGEWANLE